MELCGDGVDILMIIINILLKGIFRMVWRVDMRYGMDRMDSE